METDEEHPDYEEIIGWFRKVSISMIPAMLIELVEIGYARNVFNPGGASSIVKKTEVKLKSRQEWNKAPKRGD